MIAVKGEVSKYATTTGEDPTDLGRWNYVDLVTRGNKVRFISASNVLSLNQHWELCIYKEEDTFLLERSTYVPVNYSSCI